MIDSKWGMTILEKGWVPVPINLLRLQSKLGVNSTEMVVLIHLISYWRDKNSLIYPSQESLAESIGVTKRTIQRSMRKLEKLELISISKNSLNNGTYLGRNIYDLTPLINTMNKLLGHKYE